MSTPKTTKTAKTVALPVAAIPVLAKVAEVLEKTPAVIAKLSSAQTQAKQASAAETAEFTKRASEVAALAVRHADLSQENAGKFAAALKNPETAVAIVDSLLAKIASLKKDVLKARQGTLGAPSTHNSKSAAEGGMPESSQVWVDRMLTQ